DLEPARARLDDRGARAGPLNRGVDRQVADLGPVVDGDGRAGDVDGNRPRPVDRRRAGRVGDRGDVAGVDDELAAGIVQGHGAAGEAAGAVSVDLAVGPGEREGAVDLGEVAIDVHLAIGARRQNVAGIGGQRAGDVDLAVRAAGGQRAAAVERHAVRAGDVQRAGSRRAGVGRGRTAV